MQKTIGVTGASGHIGNVVCRMLLEKGYPVRAMYHTDERSLEDLPLEKIKGDVLNRDDLLVLFEGCDIVINCAAIITIHGDPTGIVYKTNTAGPENVVDACIKKKVKRLIHISSVHAVNEIPLTEPFAENRPYKTKPDPVYDFSKAVGEQIVLANTRGSSLEVIIVRPSSVIGPYDFKPSEMGKALLDFYFEKIPALPEGGYDFVDVRDVGNSILAAMEKGTHGDIFILSGKYYTLQTLATTIRKVTGRRTPRFVIPYRFLLLLLPFIRLYSKMTGAAPLFTRESIKVLKYGHPHMDHSRAKLKLGHECRSLETTLRDFYTWQHLKINEPYHA